MIDDERSTDEFAWVHQAYRDFPAAAPEAIDRAVTATMVAVGDAAGTRATVAAQSRQRREKTLWRWSPWIALGTLCGIVVLMGTWWHTRELAKRRALDALLADLPLPSPLDPQTLSRHHAQASTGTRTPSTPLDAGPEGTSGSSQRLAQSQRAPAASSHASLYDRDVEGLDATAATAMVHLLDSAQARGVPIDGVAARIREGVRRGASSQQIALVAQRYVASLDSARTALGASATAVELQAGAEALLAGTPPSALRQLRVARPSGPLIESLVALADLSTHGVAPLQASTALAALAAHDKSDAQIRALRTAVIGDIVRGVLPAAALAYRTHGSASNSLQPVGHGADSMTIPGNSP